MKSVDHKKHIRIKFTDFYGLTGENNPFYPILSELYEVELSERPDYIIDGGLGVEHLNYDCIKILFVGESYVPDFNLFDYALGFDHLSFGDRYLRFPLFAFYDSFKRLSDDSSRQFAHCADKFLRRDFCSFVVSNADGDPLRLEFFKRLSKYKPVASGGKLFNNVGGRVPDKLAFLAKHKFNIAFENSAVPGYTTEKVMEPLVAGSVPIYYGNPLIDCDFNPACMVRVASRDDVERAVEEIIALDRDDAAYLGRLAAPKLVHDRVWYEAQLKDFFRSIFDRPLASARRLNDWGYQLNIRKRAVKAQKLYRLTHPAKWFRR